MCAIRGIRGAVNCDANTISSILSATHELIKSIWAANPNLCPEDIASILFTVTPDLNAAFPAYAVREMGWVNVPILCAQEIPVPGGLPSCIRVLIHWNTNLEQTSIEHVYLGEAKALRPDIAKKNE
jgi:chorismate mutase